MDFKEKCYEAYQLDWMLSHGLSLNDLYRRAADILLEELQDHLPPFHTDEVSVKALAECIRERFLFEDGFGSGSLFVCKEEFLDNEFLDEDYMLRLLSAMPLKDEKIRKWRQITGIKETPKQEKPLEVATSAGILRAYKSTDPGQPGICVMLEPDAYEEEIDVSFVSVVEDPDCRTEDIVIMTYADPTTEDYTSKDIIRREDVIAGFGTAGHA